jgi:hypothetical protein
MSEPFDFNAEYDRLRAEMYEPKPDVPETTDLPGTYEEWLEFTGTVSPQAMNDRLYRGRIADVEVHQTPRKEEFVRLIRQHFDPEFDDGLNSFPVQQEPVSFGKALFFSLAFLAGVCLSLSIGYNLLGVAHGPPWSLR